MDLRDKRLGIIEVQQNLRELYKAGWKIILVTPDGIYGAHTRKAVTEFQKLSKLPDNGIVDYTTWTELTQKANEARADRLPSTAISPFNRPLSSDLLQKGECSDLIYLVQLMLNETQSYNQPLTLTGTVDEETCQALIDFQEKNALEPTGEINRSTWDALANAYNKYLPQTAEY